MPPAVAAAAVAGGVAAHGAKKSREAVTDATAAQTQAADRAIEFQQGALDDLRADLGPFRELGVNVLGPLQERLLQQNAPSQALSPQVLQNPLLRAMQDDVARRLRANQAQRGTLESGGAALELQKALIPQAIDFALTQESLDRQQSQQEINNLLAALGIGQASAAQTGAAAQGTATNIGGIVQGAGQAQAQGRLNETLARNQLLGALGGSALQALGGLQGRSGRSARPSGTINTNFTPTAQDFRGLEI